MPEITSKETVLAKLREFDERIDGAINAASSVVRVQANVERLEQRIMHAGAKSDEILSELAQIKDRWNKLEDVAGKSLKEMESTLSLLVKELDDVQSSLDTIVEEAALKIRREMTQSISEQTISAEAAKEYANISKNSVAACETIVKNQEAIFEKQLSKTENYIYSLKSQIDKITNKFEEVKLEYNGDFTKKYQQLLSEVAKHAELMQRTNQQDQKEFKQNIIQEQAGFFEKTTNSVDLQLTSFLAKQNTLVQNLIQQIGGMQGTFEQLHNSRDELNTKYDQLVSKVRDAYSNHSRQLSSQSELIMQLQERDAAREAELKLLKIRFETVVEKLQGLSFGVGNKFTGI